MLVACSALYICATNMEYVYTKFPWYVTPNFGRETGVFLKILPAR